MTNLRLEKNDDLTRIILFDGVCKLCSFWSRFIIRVDKRYRFKLCTVQSDLGQALLQRLGYPLDHFDTMLLVHGDQVYTKSDAFVAVVKELPAPWAFARVVRFLPKAFRDGCYDWVARNRYRLFGRYDDCLLPLPEHEQHFYQ